MILRLSANPAPIPMIGRIIRTHASGDSCSAVKRFNALSTHGFVLGLTITKDVTVPVGNGNHAPTNITLALTDAVGVKENATANQVIGTLGAADLDAGDTFTYALVTGGADNDLVEIVGSEIRVKSDAKIDFEANPTLDLKIQVTDQGGLTFTKDVSSRARRKLSRRWSSLQRPSAGGVCMTCDRRLVGRLDPVPNRKPPKADFSSVIRELGDGTWWSELARGI